MLLNKKKAFNIISLLNKSIPNENKKSKLWISKAVDKKLIPQFLEWFINKLRKSNFWIY
jgi:Ni,Fe-hydrogenase III component G